MAMPFLSRCAAAALLLCGCNLSTAALFAVGASDGDGPTIGNLEVRFSPGLPLVNAALEAPAAFGRLRGAAARLDAGARSLGEAGVILEGELLQTGMMLPIPAGVLTIRTIAPEAQPIEAALVPVEVVDGEEAELPLRQLPEVVGAYSAGPRTMLLATDGSFVITGPAEPITRGDFYLAGKQLRLAEKSGQKLAFAPVRDGWRDDAGRTYILIHELGAEQSARPARGGR